MMVQNFHSVISQRALRLIIVWLFSLALILPVISEEIEAKVDVIRPIVEVEEIVTSYQPADNGAGPLWCYGSTVIARQGNDVYLSIIETSKDIPPLCNTRWQLWHLSAEGWKVVQTEKQYRQREPCPLAIHQKGNVFLSVNPSTEPPGAQYGRCQPLVLEFNPKSGSMKTHEPVWAEGAYFTDHSYRGFAADGVNNELLLLNIDAKTGEQYVCYYDDKGKWYEKGKIKFPIRSCYPQVALRNNSAHIMAIGDIVEPVEEWRKLKSEKLKREWDYVFRRLFYTFTPNIQTTPFTEPMEVDTVEKTCGHIQNLDLYVDETGVAHLLYLKRPYQYDFIRDKYFPEQPMTVHLEYVTIKDDKLLSRKTLTETPLNSTGIGPSYGRFHISADGQIWVLVAGVNTDGGANFGNYLGQIQPNQDKPRFVRINLKRPFRTFFTNTPRGGSEPSNIIDLFGIAEDSPNLRYARIRLEID